MAEPMTGGMVEADFPTNTLKFEMQPGYYAAAGLYAILPATELTALQSELRDARERLARVGDFADKLDRDAASVSRDTVVWGAYVECAIELRALLEETK